MKTKRKTVLVVMCTVVVAVPSIWLAAKFLHTQDDRPPATVAEAKRAGAGKIADVGRARARRAEEGNGRKAGAAGSGTAAESRRMRRLARRKPVRREIKDPYTPAERHLADNLQSASDDNDLDNVRRAVADIMSQKNPALKQEAISTLRFFGKDALADLMAFLRDPIQEVVDSAIDAISSSLDELDDADNAFKAEFISSLLSINDLCGKDAVERFSGMLESLGSGNERLAVQTIVGLIEGETVADDVKSRMKEAYSFVTGEEYTTFEAAERWYAEKTEEDEADAAGESDDEEEPDDDEEEPDDDDEPDGEDEPVAEAE